VRPDIDNYAKAILDALNGVMWADDGQIVQLTASKSYGEPRVEIEIQEVS
jgi:Holliday junction resolvase RusA-like endonuclease